jgi:hypothetical protein
LRGVLSETRFGDLRLLVSELVAEAAGAFGGTPSEALIVQAEADRNRILVSVQEGPKSFPTSSSAPEPGTRGWSLHLVQRVSDRWGLRREHDAAAVWFELNASQPPPPLFEDQREPAAVRQNQ